MDPMDLFETDDTTEIKIIIEKKGNKLETIIIGNPIKLDQFGIPKDCLDRIGMFLDSLLTFEYEELH